MNGASARSRRGCGNRAKISRRSRRSRSGRRQPRSTWARVSSISLSYCTPEGQAVTHAMQPRQLSRWPTISADSGEWCPSSMSTIRPRGESASSPHRE